MLGLCLVARSARGRIFGMAAGAVLLVAVMRIPLRGYAAAGAEARLTAARRRLLARGPARRRRGCAAGRVLRGGPDPLLDHPAQGLEGRRADLPRASRSAPELRRRSRARPTDITRAHDSRDNVPPGRQELGRPCRPRPRHDAASPPGANPPVASTHLFWNPSLEHVALLDERPADRLLPRPRTATIASRRNRRRSTASPVTGPVLVEEYAAVGATRARTPHLEDDRARASGCPPRRRASRASPRGSTSTAGCRTRRGSASGRATTAARNDALHAVAALERADPDGRAEGRRHRSKRRRAFGRKDGSHSRRRPRADSPSSWSAARTPCRSVAAEWSAPRRRCPMLTSPNSVSS